MTREIQFRAWHPDSRMSEFTFNDLEMIAFPGRGVQASVAFLDGDVRGIDELEIMQFTDLSDINGKEIYEGDILRSRANGVTEIVWDERKGRFISRSKRPGYWDFDITAMSDSEVIGNIHENPDLLEQKS